MKMPAPSPAAVRCLADLAPSDPRVTVKKLFGQPAAFVNGNLFFGVFGSDLFVRLSEHDAESARLIPGSGPLEPMKGRPMRGYVVLPAPLWKDRKAASSWVQRSLEFAAQLPPKTSNRSRTS